MAAETAALFLFTGLPSLARLLGGSFPPALDWLLAAAAIPAVLLADAAHKSTRTRGQPATSGARATVHLGGTSLDESMCS